MEIPRGQMKSPLSSPTLFLLVGRPGSGKTYLARHLAKQLSLPVVSMERIRQTILKKPSLAPGEESTVWQVGMMLVEGYLSVGLGLIADLAANTVDQRAEILRLGHFFGVEPLIIWQQTDRETAWARCLNRQPGRRVDDSFSLKLSRTTFNALSRQLEPPRQGRVVVVNGCQPFANQLAAITRHLVELQLLPAESTLTRTVPKPGLINLIASRPPRPKRSDFNRRNDAATTPQL